MFDWLCWNPHGSGDCNVGFPVFLHFGFDSVNITTLDCPCWNFRTLSICYLGTPRLDIHCHTMYRFQNTTWNFFFLFGVFIQRLLSEYHKLCCNPYIVAIALSLLAQWPGKNGKMITYECIMHEWIASYNRAVTV